MPCRRRLFGLLAPVALTCLPACGTGPLLPLRDDPPVFPPPPDHHANAKIPFAAHRQPLAPGESVPLHPAVEEAVVISPPLEDATPIPTPLVVVKEKPTSAPSLPVRTDPPLVAGVREFAAGNPEAAIVHLQNFDKPNQELLLQLIPLLVRASQMNLARPDADEATAMARQLESAAAELTRRGGLTVTKAVLCSNVDGYGRFTPVRDRNAIIRGDLYPLYVEVGNVPCEPHTRKQDGAEGYQTRLDVSMQVTDDLGRVIEIIDQKTGEHGSKSTSEKTEFSYSPIRDYYVVAQVQAPKRPGSYTVTIELRDPKSGTVVSRPVPFRVQ